MFELLDEKKPFMSGGVTVCGVLTGAFGLGLLTGLLLAHALPFDPPRILCLLFFVGWTAWFAVVTFKRDTAAPNQKRAPAVSKT
jgi:hypothetical protein